MTADATTAKTALQQSLYGAAAHRFQESIDCVEQFFATYELEIAVACERLAERFRAGGRLFAFGVGGSASDAQHVSVEFVHPVIVGKRALPAIALTNDTGSINGDPKAGAAFTRQLDVLANAHDIALGIAAGALEMPTVQALTRAAELGMFTIAVLGSAESDALDVGVVDMLFRVPTQDTFVAQEVQETLYHVLWELVHVFLEHGDAGA